MAITSLPNRQIFEQVTRFQGFVDGSSEIVTTSDCWLTLLVIHNTGNSDATFTLSDRSGVPVAMFSLYRVTGSATDRDTFCFTPKDGLFLPGGFTILASTGNQLFARGVFRR
jgi:hypothetical protein